MPVPRVLSLQTPLLGNATYGELLRQLFATSGRIAFDAHWADEERTARERTIAGRLVYRACFTFARDRRIRERNADLYPLRYELGSSYWARRLWLRELRRAPPDVVHLHTQGLALAALDLMRRVPTVVSCDATSRLAAEQSTRAGWRWTHAPHHALEAAAFRNAAALVAFSHDVARSMVAAYGIAARKVHVISPGVDLVAFGDIGLARAHRKDPVRRILFVGGEYERKGGPEVVRAFLRRFAERDDVALDLVTQPGANVPAHPRIAVHSNIVPYSPAWRALYEAASLLVLPTHREAYGLVYLEAAAARLPVIGSTVGAGPELVLDGVTGRLVRPGDEDALGARLAELLDDAALRSRFGAAGRARIEAEFDARRNAERLETLFTRVAGEAPAARR